MSRKAFYSVSCLHWASPARSASQYQVSSVQSYVLGDVLDDTVNLEMHVLREILLSYLTVRLL